MTFLTVALAASHKKENFSCGKVLLDDYLHRQAKQDIKRMLSACFVLSGDESEIKGYYTLSAASIERRLLPDAIIRKLPPSYSDLPVILLGRLAVSEQYQGAGLGALLLMDALKRCLKTSKEVGSMAIVVDPIDEAAKQFYERYNFLMLPDSGKMFLPMATIAKLFPDSAQQ
jgi:GNAT superfamily N-acetyltransferase